MSSDTREPTRLMLVLDMGEGAGARLAAACQAGHIASVIIRAGSETAPRVATLVAEVQAAGAAALIEGDAQLARTLNADGVHLPVTDESALAYEAARELLGGRFVVGLDVGRSRHDAMTAGEAGTDYVGFGIPAFVKDRETAIERRLDLVQWWSEIFVPPCVAFDVTTVEEARALARAGADFVALTIGAGEAVADVQERVKAFDAALADATSETGR